MGEKGYEDLVAWQKAMDLAVVAYTITRVFPPEEIYGLTAQIRRAAASVPANLAEGHGRRSKPDFRRHVLIALGSLCELETYLLLAGRVGILDGTARRQVLEPAREVGRLLNGLANSIRIDR